MADFYSNVLIDLISGESVMSAALFVSATLFFNPRLTPSAIRLKSNRR